MRTLIANVDLQNTVTLYDSKGNSNEYVLPRGFCVKPCLGGQNEIYDADGNHFFARTLLGDVVLSRGDQQIPIFKASRG